MSETSIEWTDCTWNPTRGCRRVSPGCERCYAEQIAARFSGPGQPYEGLAQRRGPVGGRWTGAAKFVADKLAEPCRWRKPRRVFVNSMSDLFYEGFTDAEIEQVFAIMALCPRHTFQVLTKRGERMLAWFTEGRAASVIGRAWEMLGRAESGVPRRYAHEGVTSRPWPLPNVWLGVSVENQEYANERIPLLLQTPAAVRFISAEPLLGPVDLNAIRIPGEDRPLHFSALHRQLDGCHGSTDVTLDWVISGAESGPHARPAELSWFRSLRDQCIEAGVAFFLKQLAEHADGKRRPIVHSLPVIDGRAWAEFPEAPSLERAGDESGCA